MRIRTILYDSLETMNKLIKLLNEMFSKSLCGDDPETEALPCYSIVFFVLNSYTILYFNIKHETQSINTLIKREVPYISVYVSNL